MSLMILIIVVYFCEQRSKFFVLNLINFLFNYTTFNFHNYTNGNQRHKYLLATLTIDLKWLCGGHYSPLMGSVSFANTAFADILLKVAFTDTYFFGKTCTFYIILDCEHSRHRSRALVQEGSF